MSGLTIIYPIEMAILIQGSPDSVGLDEASLELVVG